MQFADNSGPDLRCADLGLRCPLTESIDTVVYVDEQKMPASDCTGLNGLSPTLSIG